MDQKIEKNLCDDHLQLAKERNSPKASCLEMGGWKCGSEMVHFRICLGYMGEKRRTGSERLPVVSKMASNEVPIKQRRGFLFIGRFVPNKGIRILLEAYKNISPDPILWPLTLVGDGPLRVEVEKIIAEKNISGASVTGFVSEEERHRYTRETKWMITPPHTNEDLGLTPLEARSVGVPCIATLDGGIPETAGKHALFCKPGCVESLAKSIKEAIEMREGDYEKKVLLTKQGLRDYVRPLDQYAENYLQLLKRH